MQLVNCKIKQISKYTIIRNWAFRCKRNTNVDIKYVLLKNNVKFELETLVWTHAFLIVHFLSTERGNS